MFHAVAVMLGMSATLGAQRTINPVSSGDDFADRGHHHETKSRRHYKKAVAKRRRRSELAFESRRRNW